MDDIRALTSDAECSWQYIDRLKQAHAMACQERDVVTKRMIQLETEIAASNRQVTEALQRSGFVSLDELLEDYKQVKTERDAAVKCLDEIRGVRIFCRPAYVVDELLKKLRDEVGI